jgi:uncharacterized protein (TIGR02453 family)
MAYFTKDYNAFFQELSVNNYREWFHENKKRYEDSVKKPFYKFLEHLIEAVKEYDPQLDLEPKNAVFRINRDIRFSKDKSPYKLHMAAVVGRGGRKTMEKPGIYLHMGGGNVMLAGGSYKPEKEKLAQIRSAIIKEPRRFMEILDDDRFKEVCGGMHEGEMNKILPKPFKQHVEEIPVILNKQYFYSKTYEDPDLILRDDLIDFIMDHYRASRDFTEFLVRALDN